MWQLRQPCQGKHEGISIITRSVRDTNNRATFQSLLDQEMINMERCTKRSRTVFFGGRSAAEPISPTSSETATPGEASQSDRHSGRILLHHLVVPHPVSIRCEQGRSDGHKDRDLIRLGRYTGERHSAQSSPPGFFLVWSSLSHKIYISSGGSVT